MKCGLLLFFVAWTAVSVAEDLRKSKPLATVIPAFQFSSPQVSTKEMVHKINTTTKPTTTTKKSTTTTANPTTTTTKPTTTAKPTTTTAKPTTTTAKPTTTTATPTTTTTKPTTTTAKPTTTTTVKPTTTTAKPATTTAKPTTTTAKPATTTAKPTTTTAKPTTTTVKPTTTTAKPRPPPQPTPPANLTVGKYHIITNNGTICLLTEMALQIRLVSAKVNGTFIVQPDLVTANGNCEGPTAHLNISFVEGVIQFIYNRNSTEKSIYVNALSFNLSYPFSPQVGNYTPSNNSLHLFAAKIGHSYSCRSESIDMGNGLYLDVTQHRMQAFNFTENNVFDVSDFCPADMPNYSVAIAVGVVLLVLIIIVVVAYMLGRRRRANGYQAL